jgi:hypothetical protein
MRISQLAVHGNRSSILASMTNVTSQAFSFGLWSMVNTWISQAPRLDILQPYDQDSWLPPLQLRSCNLDKTLLLRFDVVSCGTIQHEQAIALGKSSSLRASRIQMRSASAREAEGHSDLGLNLYRLTIQ